MANGLAGWWEDLTKPRLQEREYAPREGTLGAKIGAGLQEMAMPTGPVQLPPTVAPEPLVGRGFKERLAEHQAKVRGLAAMRSAEQEARRGFSLGGTAMAAPGLSAQEQQLKQRLAEDSDKKIIMQQKQGGDVTVKEETTAPDGSKITREKTANKYEEAMRQILRPEPTPEEMAYRQRLKEAAAMQPQVNLQPLAQMVDALTGSRMAPGFQDPNIAQEQRMAQRLRAAKALADEARQPEQEAYRRLMAERKMALQKRGVAAREAQAKAMKGKTEKQKDYMSFSNKFRNKEEDIRSNREVQDSLRLFKGKEGKLYSKANILPRYQKFFTQMSKTKSAEELGNIFSNIETQIGLDWEKNDKLDRATVFDNWHLVQQKRREMINRIVGASQEALEDD